MTISAEREPEKRLKEYLPAIFQENASGDKFFEEFLSAFEAVLLGHPEAGGDKAVRIESLKRKIDRLYRYFDPANTPEEFLPWLAGWVALSVRADLGVERQRKLIAAITRLYRIRGTPAYLEQLLELYLGAPARVLDAEAPSLQVGTHSTVGEDTYIGGGPAYFFRVLVKIGQRATDELEPLSRLAHYVIQLAKPAHTYYELEFVTHHMQWEVYSGGLPEQAQESGPANAE